MARPIFILTVFLMVGIMTGSFFRLPLTLPLWCLLLLILALITPLRNWRGISLGLGILTFFFIGVFQGNLHTHYQISDPDHIFFFTDDTRKTIEGFVLEGPEETTNGSVFVLGASRLLTAGGFRPVTGKIMFSLPFRYPLRPGDFIRVHTVLREPRGYLNPGNVDTRKRLARQHIHVQGRIVRQRDIVLLRRKDTTPLLKERLRRIITANSDSPARELILTLLLGEKRLLPPQIRESFQRTGTSHILAISGLHIGMIASFSFFLIFTLMKAYPPLLLFFDVYKIAGAFAFLPVLLYASISGGGISVLRATIMIVAFLVAILLHRERDHFQTLALAALIILNIDPPSLFEPSFQLSFAAVLSLISAVPLLTNLWERPKEDAPIRKKVFYYLLMCMLTSLVATLGTLPIVAHYFQGISTISLPANLVVIPLIGGLVLPLGLLAIFTSYLSSSLAAFLVKGAALLCNLTIKIIDFLGNIPGSYLLLKAPSLWEIIILYLIMILGLLLIKATKEKEGIKRRYLAVGLIFLILSLFAEMIFTGAGVRLRESLSVTAVDVGHGSGSVLKLPGGKNILIDGGGTLGDSPFDIGQNVLGPFLLHQGIKELEIVVLTHPHPDHLKGLLYILEHFKVKEVWVNGQKVDSPYYLRFLKIIGEKKIILQRVSAASPPRMINGCLIECLNPPKETLAKEEDFQTTNDASLVLMVTFGGCRFLFTGDISETVEKRLIAENRNLKCDVLFVPHHGGKTSSSEVFLRITKPKVAVISCGWKNPFHLPHPDVIHRLTSLGIKVYRTDLKGAITIETSGGEPIVKTFSNSYQELY